VREDLARFLHDFLDRFALFAQDVRERVFRRLVHASFPDVLGIVLITFFGRDSAGGSMGFFEIALLLQRVHFVADRRA